MITLCEDLLLIPKTGFSSPENALMNVLSTPQLKEQHIYSNDFLKTNNRAKYGFSLDDDGRRTFRIKDDD